jgi:hypothetical protein
MDEKQLEGQSRLLIELGEPESWLETMLRAARRSALHADDSGDDAMAKRWRNLTRALEYASAAAAHDPLTAGEPSDSATQSQSQPTPDSQAAIAMPPPGKTQSPAGLKDTTAIIEGHRP